MKKREDEIPLDRVLKFKGKYKGAPAALGSSSEEDYTCITFPGRNMNVGLEVWETARKLCAGCTSAKLFQRVTTLSVPFARQGVS